MESTETTTTSPTSTSSERGKLFIGGIPSSTTEAELRSHFEQFGEVAEAVAIRDRNTGNGRGFGFVRYVDPDSADRALKESEHIVHERAVEVKKAVPRGERHNQSFQHYHSSSLQNGGMSNSNAAESSKKIFVGGLPSNLDPADFKKYFEKFGEVVDVVVMYDNATKRARGFGFITFDSEESVEIVLQNSRHELYGKTVEVKRAIPKDDGNNNQQYNGHYRTNGRGPSPLNYQSGIYPGFGPRYGYFPSYGAPLYPAYSYGPGGYVSGYPYGSYVGSYPFAPRSPWSGPGLVSPRRSPLPPYYSTPIYPGYLSNGFGSYMGMSGAGYPLGLTSTNTNWTDSSSDVRITELKEVDNDATPQPDNDSSDSR